MEEEVKCAKRNEAVRMTSLITWLTTTTTSLQVRFDDNDVEIRTFLFFETGLKSVRLRGKKASQRDIVGIWSFGGRLSTLATFAARSVARRPIAQKDWSDA